MENGEFVINLSLNYSRTFFMQIEFMKSIYIGFHKTRYQ